MSDSGSEVSKSRNISAIRPTAGIESPVQERRISTERTEEMGTEPSLNPDREHGVMSIRTSFGLLQSKME
ncbi:hypothetical protein Bca4012_092116 [Brassica carinata]|uniref:Uncharacterized protein n=1 Tax=Brassica carinata TaxID=52824 RepID=A0A8X7PQ96_BRACI|nr:hypothetical protein Bca52824_074574 [Brassica carinata]